MHFERAAAILRGVEAAPRFGVAAPLPADDLVAETSHQAFPQSRIRAVRSWLFALGYLARNEDRADYDATLTAAVKQFQQDAGLTADGWIGARQTWPRLQELVTFEQPLDPDHWSLSDGSPRRALTRAVQLRLSVYGLQDEDALGLLDDLLVTMGAQGLAVESRLARYASVLDHDALLGEVARAAQRPAMQRMMADPGGSPMAASIWGLMLNMAKVELWLAQEAETDLTHPYRGRLRFGRSLNLPRELRADMAAYMSWVDEEIDGVSGLRTAFRRAVRADAPYDAVRLFLATVAQHGQVSEPFAEDRLALLETFYGGAGNAFPRRSEETVKALAGETSFRTRLWDGLRRLWSWMKTALVRAIATGKKVLKLARELASYVFQATSQGLRQVLQAIGAFVRHADTALDRSHMDPRGWVGVRREFGRDVNLFVSPTAPRAYVDAWTEQVALSAAIFRRASSVLRYAIALGLAVTSFAVGPPLVLRSLLGVVRNLRRTVSVLGEIARLQARHDKLDKVLARA